MKNKKESALSLTQQEITDYVRVGLPLAIVLWCIATWLIPILWPFASINA